MLSLFEQEHFTDDNKITKEFNHKLDTDDIKLTTYILHFSGTNPSERRKIETEQEAWRTVNAMFEDKEKEYNKALAIISEKDNVINEKDNVINEKDNVINEKDKLIEELMKRLNEIK